MSRLWDIASRPFNQLRYRGDVIPDYVVAARIGDVLATTPKPIAVAAHVSPIDTTPAKKVVVDNGYFAQLMLRDQTVIDYTDEQNFDWPVLAAGGTIQILSRTVPEGRAWHIDNLYFFARALGGVGGSILLGPDALIENVVLTVFVSSSQLGYEAYNSEYWGVNALTSFPFLNDRIGPREAKFGITLFGGEVIRAKVRARIGNGGGTNPPTYAVMKIGFRCMGVQGSRAEMEDYLSLKRWS